MKAWEYVTEMTKNAIPVVLQEEEQGWTVNNSIEESADRLLSLYWASHVPGSFAPESIIIAGIQSAEQLGYDVSEAESLIPAGLQALESNDMQKLQRVTGEIRNAIRRAPVNADSEYWRYKEYWSFDEYREAVAFPAACHVDVESEDFRDRVRAGWLARLIGGAFGTELEGYTTENLKKMFGRIDRYMRKPNTYNDDITYEIALLEAVLEKGGMPDAKEIGLKWLELIPSGWSAEQIALDNLRNGIFPPDSAKEGNPFREWIGAQMRGAICGQISPGNAAIAAELAWRDASVSHTTNGVLGEIFNAVITSLAYVETDMRAVVEKAIALIPADSQYRSVVSFALEKCRTHDDWEEAWAACRKRYERYNWIHAYPNAAAEVVALWFGNGDFDDTLEIIGTCGVDVDCNAAQIMIALAAMKGSACIDSKWSEPFGDDIITYLRGMKRLSLDALCRKTAKAASLILKEGLKER